MKKHVRHFESEHFGKSRVTVATGDESTGVVSITLPGPASKTAAFTFDARTVLQMTGDPQLCPETVMRIAIQQMHRLFYLKGMHGLFGNTVALAVSTPPWIGDLAGQAYGGPTQGDDGAPENGAQDS